MKKHNKPMEADFNPRSLVGSLTISCPLVFAEGLFYKLFYSKRRISK
jgi:hypothetical protein